MLLLFHLLQPSRLQTLLVSTGITLTQQVGSALSPLSRANAGSFTGLETREQAGNIVNMTIASGESSGTASSSGTGFQKGQRVIGTGIPADTYVHSVSGSNIVLSKAVYSANPSGITLTNGCGCNI